uniref:Uncharacterized protein n=1 Tax=unidentified TaxID=32644 RepID=A0A6G9W0T7_9ZZZZ|nr:hypothetical protein [unidentified]
MARYYSYGRGRYGRRYYRRGYRRYGGTSLRRYRSIQMNDNETKVMTFSTVSDLTISLSGGSAATSISPLGLLGGGGDSAGSNVRPSAGRAFFAGMMFDRFRFRSLSVSLRPKVMPSASATNYVVYAAWDRYSRTSNALSGFYSIRTDPSAKQVVWTPGGSGTPLRTWIYSTLRDRYQYIGIEHDNDLSRWYVPVLSPGGPVDSVFWPILLLAVEAVTAEATTVQLSVQSRITVEFQGGFSSTTLNYTPSTAAAAASARALTPDEIPNAQVTEL